MPIWNARGMPPSRVSSTCKTEVEGWKFLTFESRQACWGPPPGCQAPTKQRLRGGQLESRQACWRPLLLRGGAARGEPRAQACISCDEDFYHLVADTHFSAVLKRQHHVAHDQVAGARGVAAAGLELSVLDAWWSEWSVRSVHGGRPAATAASSFFKQSCQTTGNHRGGSSPCLFARHPATC